MGELVEAERMEGGRLAGCEVESLIDVPVYPVDMIMKQRVT
jgi:hypothetical protein